MGTTITVRIGFSGMPSKNSKHDFSVGKGLLHIKGTYKKSNYGRKRETYKLESYKNTVINNKPAKDFLSSMGIDVTRTGTLANKVSRLSILDLSLKTQEKLKLHGNIKVQAQKGLEDCSWLDKYGGRYHLYITRKAGNDVGMERDTRGRKRANGKYGAVCGYILDSKESSRLWGILHRGYYIGDDWVIVDVYEGLVSKFSICKLSSKDMNLLDIFDGEGIDSSRVPEEITVGGVFMYK